MVVINVNIRKLRPDAIIPTSAPLFDLYAAEGGVIAPGQVAKIPLGIAFDIPDGYVLIATLAQDTAYKTALRMPSGIHVIGAGDAEEVAILLDNTAAYEYDDESGDMLFARGVQTLSGEYETWDVGTEYPLGSYLIRKGEPITQGYVVPVASVEFTEVSAEAAA